MEFINVSYKEFINNRKNRKIIHFGASSTWHYYLKTFPDISSEILDHTLFIVDNSLSKQGQQFEINGRQFPVKNVEALKGEENYIILITVSLAYQKSICEQLLALGLPRDTECYSLPLMTYNFHEADNSCVKEYFESHKSLVIQPIIHSFWFSGEEKPDLYKKCVESWYKYCPAFEIIEWNEKNYDVTKNQYMREAFEHKKWAFVSDYARLDVLYQHGGIYLDMDVELVASLTPFCCADSFFCRQEDGFLELGSGFGVRAGDPLVGEMLGTYKNRKLILENGEIDKTPQPEWLSGILTKYGFGRCHDSQVINERLILSNDYVTCHTGKGTVKDAKIGIHWHNGGWLDAQEQKLIKDSFEAKDELTNKYFTMKNRVD